MGFFDWIFGESSNVELQNDLIWLTRQAKFAGIRKAVDLSFTLPELPVAVILVAQFKDCLAELQALGKFDGAVTATLAGNLDSVSAQTTGLNRNEVLNVIVAERHPLSRHDEGVLQFARSLPCRCRVQFHMSLEDALLKSFAGEWVEKMLKQLGMTEDEAIESRMVERRIKDAQRKFENRAVSDLPADSASDWIDLNCRLS